MKTISFDSLCDGCTIKFHYHSKKMSCVTIRESVFSKAIICYMSKALVELLDLESGKTIKISGAKAIVRDMLDKETNEPMVRELKDGTEIALKVGEIVRA